MLSELRTGVIPHFPKLDDKLVAVGLPSIEGPGGHLSKALMALVAVLKLTLAVNNWVVKSPTLALLLALVGLPGLALASYSHLQIGEPLSESIPIYVMMTCLAITAFTSDAPAGKAKEK